MKENKNELNWQILLNSCSMSSSCHLLVWALTCPVVWHPSSSSSCYWHVCPNLTPHPPKGSYRWWHRWQRIPTRPIYCCHFHSEPRRCQPPRKCLPTRAEVQENVTFYSRFFVTFSFTLWAFTVNTWSDVAGAPIPLQKVWLMWEVKM